MEIGICNFSLASIRSMTLEMLLSLLGTVAPGAINRASASLSEAPLQIPSEAQPEAL